MCHPEREREREKQLAHKIWHIIVSGPSDELADPTIDNDGPRKSCAIDVKINNVYGRDLLIRSLRWSFENRICSELWDRAFYPGTTGYTVAPHSFLMLWRSVWQMPQKRTFNLTSPSPVALQEHEPHQIINYRATRGASYGILLNYAVGNSEMWSQYRGPDHGKNEELDIGRIPIERRHPVKTRFQSWEQNEIIL